MADLSIHRDAAPHAPCGYRAAKGLLRISARCHHVCAAFDKCASAAKATGSVSHETRAPPLAQAQTHNPFKHLARALPHPAKIRLVHGAMIPGNSRRGHPHAHSMTGPAATRQSCLPRRRTDHARAQVCGRHGKANGAATARQRFRGRGHIPPQIPAARPDSLGQRAACDCSNRHHHNAPRWRCRNRGQSVPAAQVTLPRRRINTPSAPCNTIAPGAGRVPAEPKTSPTGPSVIPCTENTSGPAQALAALRSRL